MKKLRKLELSTIIASGADCDRVDLFRKLFGESAMVTEKLAISVSDKFDWDWAADNLLFPTGLKQYIADTVSARKRFDVDIAEARWRFDVDSDTEQKRFDTATAAQERLNSDTATAWKRRDVAIAPIWARTYINDGLK